MRQHAHCRAQYRVQSRRTIRRTASRDPVRHLQAGDTHPGIRQPRRELGQHPDIGSTAGAVQEHDKSDRGTYRGNHKHAPAVDLQGGHVTVDHGDLSDFR